MGTYTSTPKTVGSRRTVVVSDDVIELLKRYKAEQDEYRKMFHGYQMEWVAQMNNIRSRATEIVNANLIFA